MARTSGLVRRIQVLPCLVVHHHQLVADGQDHPAGVLTGVQVLAQQGQLVLAGLRQHVAFDTAGGRDGQGQQQRSRLLGPGRQVQRAEQRATDRMMDGGAGAGQPLEVLGVVLVSADQRGQTGFERGPDAVGPDQILGVAEPGGQVDVVKVFGQLAPGRPSVDDQAVGVGQHDADRLIGELVLQLPQDRLGAQHQRGVRVRLLDEAKVRSVGHHPEGARALPRGEDRCADGHPIDRLRGQEGFPGHGEAQWPVCRCGSRAR